MNENDETDSEWDSTLDFTSPRQTADKQLRPPEIEDEDASHQESIVEKPKPKERSTLPNNQKIEDHTYAEVVKKERQPQRTTKESPPPYNFRSAVSGNITPQKNEPPPGKDRKGTLYDVGSKTPAAQQDSIMSTGSWDDTDEDEKTLRELRETFKTEKKKEQEAEELRIKLESQAEDKADDGQLTNRSEGTWKSWASFGNKLGRSSNRSNKEKKKKKEGKTVPTYKDEGHYDAVDVSQIRAATQRQETPMVPPVDTFQARPHMEVKEQAPETEKITDISFTDFKPAYMSPPYVVKEETGLTYYFGHGGVQYLEVDNEEEEAMLPKIADRLERIFQRIWQEFFGALRIVTSFFILFVVEMFKYIIKYVFQPIFIGIFITTGDYVMKPVLSVLFNGFMQPTGVFCWNCCTTTKVVCSPIIEILRKILLQFAMCCQSVRCVQIFWKTGEPGPRTVEDTGIKHV